MILFFIFLTLLVVLEVNKAFRRINFEERLNYIVLSYDNKGGSFKKITDLLIYFGSILVKKTLSKKDEVILLEKLNLAGFQGSIHLIYFMVFKLLSYILVLLGYLLFNHDFESWEVIDFGIVIILVGCSGMIVDRVLEEVINNRQIKIDRSIPEAIDLLVICIESGVSLDNSILKVSEKIASTFPELAMEFQLLYSELQVLPDRNEAFENLVKRTSLEDMKMFASAVLQAQEYGTPIAQALRLVSEENRDKRVSKVEENAAKVPAKMALPMIIFILFPAVALIAAPSIINLIRVMSR